MKFFLYCLSNEDYSLVSCFGVLELFPVYDLYDWRWYKSYMFVKLPGDGGIDVYLMMYAINIYIYNGSNRNGPISILCFNLIVQK